MEVKRSSKKLRLILLLYLAFFKISVFAGSHYTPYYIDGGAGQMRYGVKVISSLEFNPCMGGYFEYRLLDYFALETGVYYSIIRDGLIPKKSEIYDMKTNRQSKAQTDLFLFKTISIPLILRFYHEESRQFSLFFGISIDALLNAKKKTLTYNLPNNSDSVEDLLCNELRGNPFSDEYEEVDKNEVNFKGEPLLNSIGLYTLLGYTYETKYGLIYGLSLVTKLSKPFINYDRSRFGFPSFLSYLDSIRYVLGYNVATLIYPDQYRNDDAETNIIPKYLKPCQECSYFVDHFIKFGPLVAQSLYAGQYGVFIEYKPIDRIGIVVGVNWGYMSYGVMPSNADIKQIESGNNKDYTTVPVSLIGIRCLSMPLIIKPYFSGKQFSPILGIRLSVLTSAKAGIDCRLDTKESKSPLVGVSVSKRYFEIERKIEGPDDKNFSQELEIKGDRENKNKEPTLKYIQLAYIIGFEYETEGGFIWGVKYDYPLTSFISLKGLERENFNSLQDVGNWTIMIEVGYNFSSLLYYYANI